METQINEGEAVLEKICNPFLEGQENEWTDAAYIIDKSLNMSPQQKQVFTFFTYYLKSGSEIQKKFSDFMKARLGTEAYGIIYDTYINSFDRKTNRMTRYAFFDEKKDIRKLYDAVSAVYALLPELKQISQPE